ncbi:MULTISPECIES: preprotein translocase subunit SecG [Achromobacter]|jgi:preprotein translocase subunit SecG|uniref:Protein-export membrane protein SecG n=1 Tax=Achromobacter aegrifaciens TaxID=1287736 RepID=A0AAD2IV64_ACHAE|nr:MULTISPECIES: preprotein translocase subunit SecG [Achromobacter]MBD9421208.1 preprotein translocase subunit SecG [Achromobacter sp. ACM04]MBD9474890.1 preprotein translocase subunit SecG [Achromobacter sp. ACM01]MDQ1758585.1 preprotein translocase subunit SecG [Achromobacter aegrifaciens]RIJ02251.1 preprotein translocase subunit SecG [Achromobacter sp. K91]CAB3646409.1 Protein-export membrane protein SecG [Achromobacter aegrifaciens]
MPLMLKILLAVQVISALAIIVLVLLQQGKGADMGSAFGSGSAGSLFGATGAANFLSRATKWAAVVFFASTAGLAYVSHKGNSGPAVDSGVMQSFPADRSVPQVPGAAPAPAGSSVPGAASVPGAGSVPAAPAKPDASVPSAPAAPATPAAPAAGEKPAETPAK